MKQLSINKDISIANTINKSFYLDDFYFDLSLKNIFTHSWQFLIHTNELGLYNNYPIIFLKDSINEEMLFTSNGKEICLLSNICTHRGSILSNSNSNNNTIQCPYHGRKFNLDGTVKSAFGFGKNKNFPSERDHLHKYKTIEFKNFIFGAIKPKIDISIILDDISERLGHYPFHKLKYNKENSQTYIINSHWALYCENYLEGMHVPFVHKGLNREISLSTYRTKIFKNGVLQYTKDSSNKDNLYAHYYWIFPNMMFNFYSWGLSINIVEPLEKERTRIRFLSYIIDGKKQPQNQSASIDTVELEDQNIVESVQKGIKSHSYKTGTYSVEYEKGIHHFHRLIAKYL